MDTKYVMAAPKVDGVTDSKELKNSMETDIRQLKDTPGKDDPKTDTNETDQFDYTENDDTNEFHPALARLTVAGTYAHLIILCSAAILLLSAYLSFEGLQSSLNEQEGLGTTGVALLYFSMIVTGLTLPHMALSYVSHKLVIILSIIPYVLFMMTGFYGSWATVVPTSLLVGAGSAHLWLSLQEYVKELARRYAALSGKTPKDAIGIYFGIFYGSFFASCISGNLASSVILKQSSPAINTTNVSDTLHSCGVEFCPVGKTEGKSTFNLPPQKQIFTYVGVCVGLAVLAMIWSALLLIKMTPSKQKQRQTFCKVFQDVTRHLIQSRDQKLLSIPCIMRGFHIGFSRADFTIAFVSCPFGVENVGYVMITYGVACAIFSFLLGRLWRKTGSLPLFTTAFCLHTAMIIVMFLWQPEGSSIGYVHAIGVGQSMWETVLSTLLSGIHSSHFQDTGTSTSCFHLLTALGAATSFFVSSFLCIRLKLYILLAISTVSFGCLVVFFTLKKREKNVSKEATSL